MVDGLTNGVQWSPQERARQAVDKLIEDVHRAGKARGLQIDAIVPSGSQHVLFLYDGKELTVSEEHILGGLVNIDDVVEVLAE